MKHTQSLALRASALKKADAMAPEPIVAWCKLLRYSRHTVTVWIDNTYRIPRTGWSEGSRTTVEFYRCDPNGSARFCPYDVPPACQPGNHWDRPHQPEPIALDNGLAAVQFETFRGRSYVSLYISTETAAAWGLA
jgi:hypothetical protein